MENKNRITIDLRTRILNQGDNYSNFVYEIFVDKKFFNELREYWMWNTEFVSNEGPEATKLANTVLVQAAKYYKYKLRALTDFWQSFDIDKTSGLEFITLKVGVADSIRQCRRQLSMLHCVLTYTNPFYRPDWEKIGCSLHHHISESEEESLYMIIDMQDVF